MIREDYAATREAVRDILTPFTKSDFPPVWVEEANAAMREEFGSRLSQIKLTGSCQYTYYILCQDDGEWELDCFVWDLFDGVR